MLYAFPDKSRRIEKIERKENSLYLRAEKGCLKVTPTAPDCIRVAYTEGEFREENRLCFAGDAETEWSYEAAEDRVTIRTSLVQIEVNRMTGSCTYLDGAGNILLREREKDSRSLEEYQTYRLAEGEEVVKKQIETPDGIKEVVAEATRIPDEKVYRTRLYLEFAKDEFLYGLGQQEENIGNLRGQTVYVHQANRKIGMPFWVSNRGYGILTDTCSPMIFNDNAFGTYIYTEADRQMSHYFLYGGNMDDVVACYRRLTGKTALLPKWAFGYIQSQERYETAEELLTVAEAYRKRNIGLDALVLDWCSWPDGMWGQKSFDYSRFPNPAELMDKLHEKDVHFMISIWPNMDPKCDNYKEMKEAGLMLPCGNIYNALSEKGRALYWQQAQEGIFRYGTDGWWCDSSEPVTPEWNHRERVEPAVMYAEFCRDTANLMPARMGNAFPLFHARALYEGQRACELPAAQGKRVVNLTRSAWTGQQKYGTILWSGDVDASFQTLKQQIAAGLHFCASGIPFWTTDIGAFFVKKSTSWFWQGDFDDTTADAGYRELFTRWYQWAAFLPVFRGHGTDCRRELWMFGEENGNAGNAGNLFYDAILAANRMRYELMPYIYSLAGKTWLEDGSMIRHLAFDFPGDTTACGIFDQYLFGESIMVCPVTEAMYFGPKSEPIEGAALSRKVYLPAGCDWYDYYTGVRYAGGSLIDADAPIDKMPLFVKAGSIIPVTEYTDRVQKEDQITFRVYGDSDASCILYTDSGDGYGYENGEYTLQHFTWSAKEQKLTDENGVEYAYLIIG